MRTIATRLTTAYEQQPYDVIDPLSLVTNQQTQKIILDDNTLLPSKRRYSYLINSGSTVTTQLKLKFTFATAAADAVTLTDVLQSNPFNKIIVAIAALDWLRITNHWMMLDSYINPHLYKLKQLENNNYEFSIDLNINYWTKALMTTKYTQMRVNIETSKHHYDNGKLSFESTSEEITTAHDIYTLIKYLQEEVSESILQNKVRIRCDFTGIMDAIYYTIVAPIDTGNIIDTISLHIDTICVIDNLPFDQSAAMLQSIARNTIDLKNTGMLDLRNVYDILNKIAPGERGNVPSGINCSAAEIITIEFTLNTVIPEEHEVILFGISSFVY